MSFIRDLKTAPPVGRTVALTAAALGITYGYDISNIAGALIFLKRDFGLSGALEGFMAIIVVVGQIVGALLGGWLANAIGRKKAMVVVAAGYVIFAAFSGLAPNTELLLLIRVLLGVTIGLAITVVPVFIAESAPSNIRGGLLTSYQVTTVIGIVLGDVVCWALLPTASWRLMLGVAAIPAVVVLFALTRVNETPNWLLMNGRDEEAIKILRRTERPEDVDTELASIKRSLAEDKGGSTFARLREMFSGYLLRATLFAIGLGFFIQITGINATIYYAPKIFEQMGFQSNSQQLLLAALVQLASLFSVIISMMIIDQFGRRRVLLSGISVMLAAEILLVIVYTAGGGFSGIFEWIGLFGLIVFTMGYTFGFGAIVWVFAGEIFPTQYRALGASVVLTADLVANLIVGELFPVLLPMVGGAGMFAIFAVLTAAAMLFVFRLAPETKGRSLDEIQEYWKNGARWKSTRVS